MGAIGSVARHRLTTGWRGWAALALLTAIAGGAVLAAAAGARRTDSAFPRFLRSTAAADVLVGPAQSGIGGYDIAVGRLPGVAQIAPVVGLAALPVTAGGSVDQAAEVVAPLDGRLGVRLQRPRMLAGRQPLPGRPGEVMVDQIAAASLGLRVGSVLRLAVYSDSVPPHLGHLTEHVVGIEVLRDSILPVSVLARTAYIQASAALYRQLGPDYQAFDGDYVKLSPGVTVAAFTAEATRLAREPQYLKATGGQLFVSAESDQDATVQRSIRPQALALAVFAAVLAVTALLILGQAVSRRLQLSSGSNAVLSALGLTRWQLLAASLLEAAVVAAAGAAAACGVAIAASPLMPIGPARLAEVHPGVSPDAVVLAPGFALIALVLVGLAARTAWHQSSGPARPASAAEPARSSPAVRWLARSGAPVTAVTGVRMALDPGRGAAAVPARTALIGTGLAVAAVMASVTFGAGLVHLERTPRLYGQNWDAAVDLQFSAIKPATFGQLTRNVPGLAGWTFGYHGTVSLGHPAVVVPAVGLAAGRGRLLTPTILAGRAPSAGQVVLGTATMRTARVRLGQYLNISASGRARPVQVVGRAVFPYFGQGSFTPTDLGQGALVPASLLAAQAASAAGEPGYNFVLVSFRPGSDVTADAAALQHALGRYCQARQQTTCVLTSQRPNGVASYARIGATPLILAGLLAMLGLGVLAQFSFESARARRREFAVLRTLGLRRRQLTAVALWQITTLTVLAMLAGLPAGAAAGRWAWAAFAHVLGIAPGTGVPVLTGLLLVPAVLLAANLVACWPARRNFRLRPAELLRVE
jgi:putative ABC transport system permease protein